MNWMFLANLHAEDVIKCVVNMYHKLHIQTLIQSSNVIRNKSTRIVFYEQLNISLLFTKQFWAGFFTE